MNLFKRKVEKWFLSKFARWSDSQNQSRHSPLCTKKNDKLLCAQSLHKQMTLHAWNWLFSISKQTQAHLFLFGWLQYFLFAQKSMWEDNDLTKEYTSTFLSDACKESYQSLPTLLYFVKVRALFCLMWLLVITYVINYEFRFEKCEMKNFIFWFLCQTFWFVMSVLQTCNFPIDISKLFCNLKVAFRVAFYWILIFSSDLHL